MSLLVPVALLVLVLPAWEPIDWPMCWTVVFPEVFCALPQFVVCRVFYPNECPPLLFPPSSDCLDPLGLRA